MGGFKMVYCFYQLALIWFLSSNLEDLKPKKVIAMSNFIIAIILLSLAIFHHLVLTGPPPPVFILITISGGMGFYAWRKSTT